MNDPKNNLCWNFPVCSHTIKHSLNIYNVLVKQFQIAHWENTRARKHYRFPLPRYYSIVIFIPTFIFVLVNNDIMTDS